MFIRIPAEDRQNEKRYSIYPIRTMDCKLVRFEATFSQRGYEDEDSFGVSFSGTYEIRPYEEGVSVVFPESEAKEICDYFGWVFDKVAVEMDNEE